MPTFSTPDHLGFNFMAPQVLPAGIENLEFADLLKHPQCMSLWTKNMEMQEKNLEMQDSQLKLMKKNSSLENKVISLERELSVAKQDVYTLNTELESLKVNSMHGPHTPFQSSPATSIHPSDSISQSHRPSSTAYVMAPPAQPAIRPPQYPFEILWLLEDCRQDPTVGVTESNKSRPAMDRAIRHPDGSMVCDAEWNAIKTSARLIVHDLASLPQAESNRIAKVRRTKVFYRSQYPRQLRTTIQQLEDQQPLLKLCASNWKADHVLGNALLAAKDPDVPLTKRRKSKDKKKKQAKGKGKEKEKEKSESESESEDGEGDDDDKEKDKSMSSKDTSSSSLRIPTLHIPSVSDVTMASPSSSGASGLKRAEPSSSPQKRDPAKKRRGEKSNERPISKINWLSGLNPGAKTATTPPPTHKADDASKLIQIDASYVTLKRIFVDEFPSIRHAIELLKAMEANSSFRAGATPILTTNFLSRIESASPAAPDLSEDDTGASWGHHQFTSGTMTIQSVLTSWESVGSTAMACKLIAAGIKTCKVARHICFNNGISTSSYLADAYLSNVVDQLWDLWIAVGGPVSTGNATAMQTDYDQNPLSSPLASSPPASTFISSAGGPSVCSTFVPAGEPLAGEGSAGGGPAGNVTTHEGGGGSADGGTKGTGMTGTDSMGCSTGRGSTGRGVFNKVGGGLTSGVKANVGLQALTKEELKSWIQSTHIAVASTNKQKTKDDLLNAILAAAQDKQPTEDQVNTIITQRKAKKAAQKAGKASTTPASVSNTSSPTS